MTPRRLLLGAFLVSGASGLAYELVWSRYLALLLGHSAYAQVVVIAVFLGGMALGAALVGRRSEKIERPLLRYAQAELLLAGAAFLFHPLFRLVSDVAYDSLLPGLPEGAALALPWALSVVLILPQSILLGATFPLMTAGLLRGYLEGDGRTVAEAYLWNSLGGAAGILIAGFLLVPRLGTLGALVVAGGGNLLAAFVALNVGGRGRTAKPDTPAPASPAGAGADLGVIPPILAAAFLTAVASFMYEIGWIRMLSLLMGSATHAFELMLSAFILGLALGAWGVRRRVDRTDSPIRLLGLVQWAMGFLALATLPLYAAAFGVVAELVRALPGEGGGYTLFNGARYGIALAVMLPSTMMAGATLPLMTGILLRHGVGERAVGQVYGVNTLGSVTGVIAAGLILLPLLGLEGLVVAGAALDMALGAWLMWWSRRREGGRTSAGPVLGVATVGVCVLTLLAVRLDAVLLTSGVYRHGDLPPEGARESLFYHDGRTASVGVHREIDSDLVALTSNGKPDASLPVDWIRAAGGETVPFDVIRSTDAATQILLPLVLMAHAPRGEVALNIGHGSGMSAEMMLRSPTVREVVTVEIEPAMVRGSQLFLPANAGVFEDRRHRFVFDDARAFLARSDRAFDLILSEPSNPWVGGVSALFTEEFYRRIASSLAADGVFGQWLQLYEIDDRLVASVFAALHRVFPDYRAYMVGRRDLLIVAGPGLPHPDWSVADFPRVRAALAHVPPLDRESMAALRVIDRAALAPLLDPGDVPANSDFRPVLDAEAERVRFLGGTAEGVLGLGTDRMDLGAALTGLRSGAPGPYAHPAVWVVEPMRTRALTRWFAEIRRLDVEPQTVPFEEWRAPYLSYRLLQGRMERRTVPASWRTWARHVAEIETLLHGETAGWADESFFHDLRGFLDAVDAPPEARAAVDFLHGRASWDWERVAAATDVLVALDATLLEPAALLDAGVVAYLRTGRLDDARDHLERFAPRTARAPDDLRLRLLRAWIDAS